MRYRCEAVRDVLEAGRTEECCCDPHSTRNFARVRRTVFRADVQQMVKGPGKRIAVTIVDESRLFHHGASPKTNPAFSRRSLSNGVMQSIPKWLQTSGILTVFLEFERFSWVTTVSCLASAWAIRM